jgi:hypothetical protein
MDSIYRNILVIIRERGLVLSVLLGLLIIRGKLPGLIM